MSQILVTQHFGKRHNENSPVVQVSWMMIGKPLVASTGRIVPEREIVSNMNTGMKQNVEGKTLSKRETLVFRFLVAHAHQECFACVQFSL